MSDITANLRDLSRWMRCLANHEPEPECKISHIECADDCSNAADEIEHLRTVITAKDAEIARLREFALEIMEFWPLGDVDGCDLQTIAIKHGLIALKDPAPTEPCGDWCMCADYATPDEFASGVDCYQKTELLTGARAALAWGGA